MDSQKRLVLMAEENPDGTLASPLQAVMTQTGSSIKPAGDVLERNIDRPTISPEAHVVGAKEFDIQLPIELKGGGVQGGLQRPELHAGLLACGLVVSAGAMIVVAGNTGTWQPGETVTNTTENNAVGVLVHVARRPGNVTQIWVKDLQNLPSDGDTLIGDGSGASATVDAAPADAWCYGVTSDRSQQRTAQIQMHRDGVRYIARRCRGSLSFDWQAGKFSAVTLQLKSLYERPSDQTLPNAAFSELLPPVAGNAGLVVGDYPEGAGTVEKLSFQLGNDVQPVPDMNSPDGRNSFRIVRRSPTGSVDPDVTELAQFDPFEDWEKGELQTIYASLGSEPGNTISVLIGGCQYTGITDRERAGLDVYDLSFRATGNDDEFYLFFH